MAKEKDVVVNTIFCGGFDEGVGTDWKSGADLTGGTYMSIEQNRKTVYIPSPYDDKISALNDQLNDTYVYYGRSGASKKQMQETQDVNAYSYSKENKVDRAVSKSTHAYTNSNWDLVDAAKENEEAVATADEKDLPAEMKGMTAEQRKAHVQKKAAERKRIQTEIQQLNKKRQEYITANTPKEEQNTSLDGAMIKAIKTKAKEKKLDW
jgi:hypothetical protein